LILVHQNKLKTPKKIIWSKEKNKKFLNFFKSAFKTNSVLRNSVKKACKNCFMKTAFQIQFFSGSRGIKRSFYSYQTPYYVFCTANTKTGPKQTQNQRSFLLSKNWKLKPKIWKLENGNDTKHPLTFHQLFTFHVV
jgi:hypothetical protein